MKPVPFLTISQLVLFVALIITTAIGYALVPLDQSLPVHWNIFGAADSFASASLVLAGPLAVAVVIGIILAAASRYSMAKGEWEGARSITVATYSAMLTVALVVSVCYALIGLGEQLDMVRILVLCVLGLLALVGNYLPKSRPNNIAGLRIPSTLADEQNWRKSHFWAGRTMFVFAIASFVVVAFGPPAWIALSLVLVTAVVPTILGTYVSINMVKTGQ